MSVLVEVYGKRPGISASRYRFSENEPGISVLVEVYGKRPGISVSRPGISVSPDRCLETSREYPCSRKLYGKRPGISVSPDRCLETSREYPCSRKLRRNQDLVSVAGNIRARRTSGADLVLIFLAWAVLYPVGRPSSVARMPARRCGARAVRARMPALSCVLCVDYAYVYLVHCTSW